MFEDWFRRWELPMSWESFARLPRHPAYRYEYVAGVARITGRPNYMHCRKRVESHGPRPTETMEATPFGDVRPLIETDWARMPKLFADAFAATVPFPGLEQPDRDCAAASLMERTRSGADGPLIPEACWVATSRDSDEPVGAVLVTLVPSRALVWWNDPAIPEHVPHLTWIFVEPGSVRRGLGGAMLRHVEARLADGGHRDLFSTFLLGHHASMLWHWKWGFQVLNHALSPGRISSTESLPPP